LELHSIQGVTAEDLSLWKEPMGRISYGVEGVLPPIPIRKTFSSIRDR
jgi:hypothetical protein